MASTHAESRARGHHVCGMRADVQNQVPPFQPLLDHAQGLIYAEFSVYPVYKSANSLTADLESLVLSLYLVAGEHPGPGTG